MNKSFELNLFELSLTNFATFQNQTIYFHDKFNSIIGETGSGKSLILEALQLILGHRAEKKIIRKDCELAIVEAIFKCKCSRIKNFLDHLGFPYEGEEIVIKRIIYKSGKSKAFLNFQSCSLQTLVSFSKQFVDLVGQFENQKLLSSKYQLQLLDNYSGHDELLIKYQKNYSLLTKTIAEYEELKVKSLNIAQRADYVNYQVSEIEKLDPSVEDELSLIDQKRHFQTVEQNRNLIDEINYLFEGNEVGGGILSLLKHLENNLHPDLFSQEDITQFQNAHEVLKDLSYSINTKQEMEINEEDFNDIIDRLDSYQKLKRKFHTSTEELVKLYQDFLLERDEFQNYEESLDLYKQRIDTLKAESLRLANKLHASRLGFASQLEMELTQAIQDLNMLGATIKIKCLTESELNSSGNSRIEFHAQTNPGEGFYPIKDIASGGELSRILLAVRNVLSSRDSISVFLFDEIDTGIGGETALTIGKTLAKVASSSQVIAITHLPQIANFSNKLIVVSKELIADDENERTISIVKEVNEEQLKHEVSLMNPLN